MVINQLDPCQKHIRDTDITVISTYTPDTSTKNRKAVAKKKSNTFVVKNTVNKVERRDYNKCQKYKAQEGFLVNIVKD